MRKTWLVTWAVEARAMDNTRVFADEPPGAPGTLWTCFTATEGGRRFFVNVAQTRCIVELDEEAVRSRRSACPACRETGAKRKDAT